MRALAIVVALSACAAPRPIKTEESMRAARLRSPGCHRVCPVGEYLMPIEPQDEHVLDDCCYDLDGLTWASCAWNAEGRFMTREQLLAPGRSAKFGCGGDGWPDCP